MLLDQYMSGQGSTLRILNGPNALYNLEKNEIDGTKYRYVIYLPWVTAESTDLPERPVVGNHPWIINPVTHSTHIMIFPMNE